MTKKLGIVITAYNAEQTIVKLLKTITLEVEKLTGQYEIIVVDDFSNDNTWTEIIKLCESNNRVKGIKLVRNFGQHNAITAGLRFVNSEFVILMDGDFQDDPRSIPTLYNAMLNTDKDIIYGLRESRNDQKYKILSSKLFYSLFTKISGIRTNSQVGTFRIMKKLVVDEFLKFGERNKYLGGIFYWMGFESAEIPIMHNERMYGRSNYNLGKLVKMAVVGIVSFSNKPLNFAIYLGLVTSFASLCGAVYYTIRKVFYGISVTGYSSIIVSLFLIGGMILFVLGIIGQYLGQIYEQTKGRPEFIIRETRNIDE